MSLDEQKINAQLKNSKNLSLQVEQAKYERAQNLPQTKSKGKYTFSLKNSYIDILLILALFSNLHTANCFTLGITSSEVYTGVSANYFFTINNHSNPTNLILTFSDWSPNLAQPFISSYMVAQNSTGNSLSCINRISKTIECNISVSVFPGSIYPSKIVLKMSGISNPSSTKPYSVSLYLNGTGGSSTQTATLTVTQPRISNLIIDNYSYEVGKKSAVLVYLTFRNYLAASTFLNITYNTLLATIDMIQDVSYYVATQNAGLKRLTNWDNPSQGFRTLKMNVTNPNFAVSVTIDALQYFIEGGIEYKIEKFTLTLQIIPTQYLQITAVSPQNFIKLGTNDNTLSLNSKCEIGAFNGPSKNAYYQITYENTVLNLLMGSTCLSSSTNGTTSICILSLPSNTANASNSFLLTRIKSLIPLNSVVTSTVVKIQSWSYFSAFSQFYTTCSTSLNIDVQPQVLSPSTTLTGCNQVVGQVNTLTLQMNVENAIVGDVLVVREYPGKIINKTGSMTISYNSASNQYESSISVAQIINSTRIQFTISFNNPTYLPSQQPSIQIFLKRKLTSFNSSLNTYGQVSTAFSICPVTSVLSNSTNNPLTLTNSSTYKSSVSYTIQFSGNSIQFKDYVLNDYFVVSFKNKVSDGTNYAETDSPFQLNSFRAGVTPDVLINSQYFLASQILTPSSLKIKLNSSLAVNLVNDPNVSSLLLTIESLSNPFFVSDVFCQIKTFTSTNMQKESLLTTLSPISSVSNSELNVESNSIITLLESNNTINLQISSLSQKIILSAPYPSVTSLYIVVKAPFSCLNTNVNNQIIFTLPALNTSNISISFSNCTLGFFNDFSKSIEVQEYARFSHPNLTQNIKTTSSFFLLRSTCGDQCHICDSNTLKCEQCFNSTYSIYNFYTSLDQKCYSTCPSSTYRANSACHSCHPVCATCSSGSFDSCITCATNYVKNSSGICESTCGNNMFLANGTCASCNVNCQGCLTENECFNCKDGAVLVGSTCVFSQCAHPCQTCEGTFDFCLSCVSSSLHEYYFHENQCLESCPEGSFKWQDSSNSLHPKVCMKIQSSNIYFVGAILTLISLGIGVGIRCCARKKTKISTLSSDQKDSLIRTTKLSNKLNESYGLKQSQQNISKTQIGNQPREAIIENILKQYLEPSKIRIFKLNLLRFMTVLMGYIEIVCAVVILIQGGIYNPKGVNQMIYVGLAGLTITNLIFGIKFFTKVYIKLNAKREKFIDINLKRKPLQIQIQPESIKQPVQEQKSDENNQENLENVQNLEDQQNKRNIDKNQAKSLKSIKSLKQMTETIPIQKLQNKKPNVESERSSEFYEDTPQEKQRLKLNRKMLSDFDNEMVKELLIGLFSTIFTLRTYNVMRSNLFALFSSENVEPNKNADQTQSINLMKSPRSVEANSNMALNLPRRNNEVQDITKTEVIGSKRASPAKTNSKQNGVNVIKIQSKEIKPQLSRKQSQRKPAANSSQVTSSPALQSNILINSLRPFISEPSPAKNSLLQLKQEYVNKFLHPFYTYIMFASLLVVSLMFAIASAILIFNNRYQNMMIWGIDALIVIGVSFFLNIFDLWKAVNLPKHDQHSQMSSAAPQVNQTMENLKPFEEDQNHLDLQVMNEDQDVNKLNATKKFSTSKKYSVTKGGASPSKNKPSDLKGGSIREQEIEIDPFSKIKSPKSPSQRTQKTKAFGGSIKKSPNKSSGNLEYAQEKPPQLKIFDDLEIEENNVDRFTKAQKLPKQLARKTQYSNGKIRSSNRSLNGRKTEISNQMISNTSRGKKPKNYKMEDIYLGFLEHEERQSIPREEEENTNTEENDEIVTVKIESRQKLQSIKQSAIINFNTEEQVGENNWKQKPLSLVENKRKKAEQIRNIEEERE